MSANTFPEDEPLPDHMSLLIPSQRAEVRARRECPPTNAFEAILRATVPVEGDPVPLVESRPAAGMPLQMEQHEEVPAELSLLTPEQQAQMRARHGGGAR